jgi:hypothetical protein
MRRSGPAEWAELRAQTGYEASYVAEQILGTARIERK